MANGKLKKRLDRLEALLLPPPNPQVLKITFSCVGQKDETIELQLYEPGRRR